MRSIKRYIKIKKILAFLVALALVTTVVPEHVFAVIINGLGYFVGSTTRYNSMPGVNSITGAYDVRGRINNNNSYTLQTTYSNGGYTIDFEVDGVNSSIQKVANNAKVVNRGVELTVRAETTAEGLDVHLDINNPEGNGDHTYRVAMTADVQLGNNDYAAIYKKNHDGVVVTQDDKSSNSDYGAKVYIDFSPAADTLWIGDYKERLNSRYTDGGVSAYTAADAVDTAVAWSWNNTITDGEASTMTASYNLIETNKTHVKFYDLDKALIMEKEALVGGAVDLLDLADDREGYIHVWCEDVADETTCHAAGGSIIVEEENMEFYENYIKDPDAWSNINYYDTNDELTDSTEELEGDTITLPDLPDDKPGYFHVWCEDKADEATCKNGGETVTVAEDDMNFYENYIVDPNYAKPEVPVIEPEQNIVDDSDDNDDIEYSVRYVSSNVDDSNSARADGGENYYTSVSQDAEPEVAVPTVDSTIRDDTIKQQLDTVKPLGVTLNENLSGEGFWGIMKDIWMYVVSILLAFGFFFFILLWKRRKDDEEEEEENFSK